MMKNRILTFLLFSVCSTIMLADDVTLQSDDKGASGRGNRTEIPTPRVHADDATVEITCDSLVTNAEVTITDFTGTVMHRSTETLSPSNTLLFVTDTPDRPKYYIEIETDEKVFYGYF